MTKCPYVPPHEFNLDFPHLMLRYRAVEAQQGKARLRRARSWPRPTATASSAGLVAPLANWATRRGNTLTAAGAGEASPASIAEAALPKYPRPDLRRCGREAPPAVEPRRRRPSAARPCSTRPASSTTTTRASAMATRAVLARNGVETEVVYPRCCGMPQLEQGDLAAVAEQRATRSPRRSSPGSTRATTSSRWCRPAR